jgi:hypothetical protein
MIELAKKIPRQLDKARIIPPRVGPEIRPMAMAVPSIPSARPLLPGGNLDTRMAPVNGNAMARPVVMRILNTINWGKEPATAHNPEPTA